MHIPMHTPMHTHAHTCTKPPLPPQRAAARSHSPHTRRALQDNKCSSQGCTQCLAGATPMLVAGTTQLKDPQYCITEYCDEVMPGMPQNPNLYRCGTPLQSCGMQWYLSTQPQHAAAASKAAGHARQLPAGAATVCVLLACRPAAEVPRAGGGEAARCGALAWRCGSCAAATSTGG